LGYAQLTWLPIPAKTPKKTATPSVFWLPNVHFREFIMTAVKKNRNQLDTAIQILFDFNTWLWPLKTP